MNCKQVDELLHTYWQLDEENPLRIEIEAHLFECEHCAANLDLGPIAFPVLDEEDQPLNSNGSYSSSQHISENVMKRIYEEEAWYMPITSKRYQFSKSFRRNVAIIIASCLAMFSIALFMFIFDYYKDTSAITTAKVSGLVDVANASTSEGVSAIYTSSIPVASISDPIVMQVVPTFPQYYVALSFVGIIMTLLVMGWFTRTRQ